MKIKLFAISLLAITLVGCEKWLEADPENVRSEQQIYEDINFAYGFLLNGYRNMPSYYNNSDLATDDAVTNNRTDNYVQIATGGWALSNNPFNMWGDSYGAILSLNQFLSTTNEIQWVEDPEATKLFNLRFRGEAFGLRALRYFFLLRNHGGFSIDGNLLGVPIITEFLPSTSDFNLPRASFDDCIKQIYADLDSAEQYLPMEYYDLSNASQIPEKYASITQNVDTYNRVMGIFSQQLFNGLIAQSYRARVALLASSPAFQDASNSTTWEMAANAAASVVNYKGGASGLPNSGHTFYTNANELDDLSSGNNPPEIIWRDGIQTNNGDVEAQNYPPSLFGTGFINPTQNLVDAFPMANGYPINHSNSGYNEQSPYAGRDPRLSHYIIYNGSSAGPTNTTIQTGTNSGTDDGINVLTTSTRTGYYMKKRLRMDVNRNPVSLVGKNHITPRIRYTEIFLIYAEAANEAWGPTGTGGNAFSAYDIVKAIRNRAGVGVSNNDPYLEDCKGSKDAMRELIRNERRLELCFESFRFWDLRRWKIDLNQTAAGMNINGANISRINVEARDFLDYMYYGPIPFSEILKYNNLSQNRGWQ